MKSLRALAAATAVAAPLVGASPALASAEPVEAPRVIHVVNSLSEGASYWSLRAAIRDWNRASRVHFVLVSDPPSDQMGHTHLTEFTELGGTVERAVDLSGVDYAQEISVNWSDVQGRDGTYRQSTMCAGLGMLVTNLPSFQAIGHGSVASLNRWASCMDPEAQWTWPLPAGMTHPGRRVLNAAR